MMDVRIVEDVETEPVALVLVKDFCRIDADYTGEDETLKLLQASARELLEGFLNLSLAPKTIEVSFSGGHLNIPYGPHTAILDVKDSDGVVIPADKYRVTGLDFKSIDTRIDNFNYFYPMNSCWPIIEPVGGFYGSGLIISAQVGYTAETLKSGLKLLILRLIDYMYQNRGSVVSDIPHDIKRDAKIYSRNSVL